MLHLHMSKRELRIGIETHAQIKTKSKLFSTGSTNEKVPNTGVTYFDAGIVGTLPRLNKEAVALSVKTGLALNCSINLHSEFDRKHYFYPDLPLGFQITQYYKPICLNGHLIINNKTIHIERIHMECDAGKMVHENKYSLLDYNRCGVGLMEIVSGPDLHSPEDAVAYAKTLKLYLESVDSCDCNMELGNFRTDVNISVTNPDGSLGTRVEIKNLNSFKFIQDAINYEFKRQCAVLDAGEKVIQETRGYNSDLCETYSLRVKEDVLDYRYVPDYNLPPLHLSQEYVDNIRKNLPELPDAKRARYHYLKPEVIEVLVNNFEIANYFDSITTEHPVILSNLLVSTLVGLCNRHNVPLDTLAPKTLNEITNMYVNNIISMKTCKWLLEECLLKDINPITIVHENNLTMINDPIEIHGFLLKVISDNPGNWIKVKNGDDRLLQSFIGNILKMTQQRANPIITEQVIKEHLINSAN